MKYGVYVAVDTISALFCLMMVFLVAGQYGNNKKRSKQLLISIVAEILVFVSDIILYIFYSAELTTLQLTLLRSAALVFYIACATLIFTNVQYGFVVIESNQESVNQHVKKAFKIIYLVSIISIATSPVTKLYYYFDEENTLIYGPCAYALIALAILYTGGLLISIMIHRKALSKRDFYSLTLYSICLVVAIFTTMFNYNSLKAYVIAAMALFLVALSNVNEIQDAYYKNKEKLLEIERQRAEDEVKILQSQLIEKDLSMAAQIQLGSLTKDFPPYPSCENLIAYATITPAKQVGGDFYDCFAIDDTHVCIVIADVSGKGIPAALFMMQTKMSIYSQAKYCKDSAVIAQNVNRLLWDNNTQRMFATAWIGILDTENMLLQYTNAGHNAPCFYREGSVFRYMKKCHGGALGVTADYEYECSEKRLMSGDILFLYTDGVTEANDSSAKMYGEDRLLMALDQNKECLPRDLIAAVEKDVAVFVGEAEQFDDLTMFAFAIS